MTLKSYMAEMEREYLSMVLTQEHGRISKVAKFAGISLKSVYRKMKKHRLDKVDFKNVR